MNVETVILSLTTAAAAVMAWYFYRKLVALTPAASDPPGLDPQRNSVLESVLEGLGDSCLLIDHDRRIIFANHETRDLFRTTEKLTDRPLHSLITDERILAFIHRVATSGVKWDEEEFRVALVRDGVPDERYLVVAAAPVRLFGEDSAGHLRVVIRDETDRHETEQIRKDFVANA